MSLRAEVKEAVDEIFEEFGDLVEDGTLRRQSSSYTVSTGVVGSETSTTSFNFLQADEKLLDALKLRDDPSTMNEAIRIDTLRVVVQAKGMKFEPSSEDKVTARSRQWSIYRLEPLYGAGYVFTLRRQNA